MDHNRHPPSPLAMLTAGDGSWNLEGTILAPSPLRSKEMLHLAVLLAEDVHKPLISESVRSSSLQLNQSLVYLQKWAAP